MCWSPTHRHIHWSVIKVDLLHQNQHPHRRTATTQTGTEDWILIFNAQRAFSKQRAAGLITHNEREECRRWELLTLYRFKSTEPPLSLFFWSLGRWDADISSSLQSYFRAHHNSNYWRLVQSGLLFLFSHRLKECLKFSANNLPESWNKIFPVVRRVFDLSSVRPLFVLISIFSLSHLKTEVGYYLFVELLLFSDDVSTDFLVRGFPAMPEPLVFLMCCSSGSYFWEMKQASKNDSPRSPLPFYWRYSCAAHL